MQFDVVRHGSTKFRKENDLVRQGSTRFNRIRLGSVKKCYPKFCIWRGCVLVELEGVCFNFMRIVDAFVHVHSLKQTHCICLDI